MQNSNPDQSPSKMDALTEAIDKAGVYDNAVPSIDGAAPSGTPRTDAIETANPIPEEKEYYDMVEHARTLERDLVDAITCIAQLWDGIAAKDAEIAQLRQDCASIERDTLRAEVERLKQRSESASRIVMEYQGHVDAVVALAKLHGCDCGSFQARLAHLADRLREKLHLDRFDTIITLRAELLDLKDAICRSSTSTADACRQARELRAERDRLRTGLETMCKAIDLYLTGYRPDGLERSKVAQTVAAIRAELNKEKTT